MPGRHQTHGDAADPARLAVGERLHPAARALAVAPAHDRQRLRRRQHRAVAGPRVVAVAVRDDGAAHPTAGIDEEIARLAIQAGLGYLEPVFGFGGRLRHE